MRFYIAIIVSILSILLFHLIYNIASTSNFYIAFIGGAITITIFSSITNLKKEKKAPSNSKGVQRKFRKKDIIWPLLIVILFILSNNNYIKSKLATTIANIKFKIITQNMKTKKYDNIMYYYTGEIHEKYLNSISNYIKDGDNKATELFGQTTAYPLNLVLFQTSEAFSKTFKVDPKNSQAVTIFNSIYIPNDNINEHVFIHEYTHYKMSSFYKDNEIPYYKIPSWFQEGVAEYASLYLESPPLSNVKLDKIQDFKNLDKSKEMSSYQLQGYDTYTQSYLAIKKIEELKGINVLQDILINTKSMNFYNAFEKVVGITIEDFQNLLK
jgi:hypothetical protein